ncbi:hypothetical protein [Terrabacter sp. Root85]|uniref:hypothetical protein n=1 Tax=Terrabacter sp. Root85 TaxID=1736603 RepID=UPI001F228DC5|nr:hypothetical protein [Terrabacter sp. Root85]
MRAAVRLAALCVVAGSLGACGSAAPPPASRPLTTAAGVVAEPPATAASTTPSATPSVAVPADLTIRRKTWGGLCPGGPCGSSLVVTASGAWVLSSEGATRTGTLPWARVVALALAARSSHLDTATGTPDCAANHDGTSVAYSWTIDGVTRSASSCDHPIDRSDPLAVQVEEVARSIKA